MSKRWILLLITLLTFIAPGFGQTARIVRGKVLDPNGHPLDGVSIRLEGSTRGTSTNQYGIFSLGLPDQDKPILIISHLGFQDQKQTISGGGNIELTIELKNTNQQLKEVSIETGKSSDGILTFSAPLARHLTTVSGGIESLIATLPGVSSHSELSSTYSVHGGNYDENLAYIQGVEIMRPFLIKSGEREGLSPINPDMTGKIGFSSGGFDATYGDKMSSVLDITYRHPTGHHLSSELGALGGSLLFEGINKGGKFTYLTGVRYHNTAYLLGTLDQKGEYAPSYTDLQSELSYTFNPKLSLSLLTLFSSNSFQFTPQSELTRFGTIYHPYQFMVYFDGREKDHFDHFVGAITLSANPTKALGLTLQASTNLSAEQESYDLLGEYNLSDVVAPSPDGSPADSTLTLGTGAYLRHARNHLTARIYTLEQRGTLKGDHHTLQWGIKGQHEFIQDQTQEWEMRDSAGYSLPIQPTGLSLYRSVATSNRLSSTRISGFIQEHRTIALGNGELTLQGGIRMQYWDFNRQTMASPRFAISWKPNADEPTRYRLAWGLYDQAPFYKELKNREGLLTTGIKAQRAIHYVLGIDQILNTFERPVKLSAEAWFKRLHHLIPYQIDNLEIRYLPGEEAKGYAAGVDFRATGELANGAQSWASISLMKSEEDLIGDHFIKLLPDGSQTIISPGYIPRPTDQRVNISLFLQDYFPGDPSIKLNMTLLYGSRLPFGPANGERYRDVFRMPPYRRVDAGLTKTFSHSIRPKTNRLSRISKPESWVTLELFNLFGINNTASYLWVADIYNNLYAVPHYLTGRRINLKVGFRF